MSESKEKITMKLITLDREGVIKEVKPLLTYLAQNSYNFKIREKDIIVKLPYGKIVPINQSKN